MKYNADKPLRLLRQLAENAHQLQKLSCDLTGTNPKMALEKIIRERPTLTSLKVEGLPTEAVGLKYFDALAENNNLKKLNLIFLRLDERTISKQEPDHFPVKGNMSIETLKIKLFSSSRPQSIATPQWRSFFNLFGSVGSLTIEQADLSTDATFLRDIVREMPRLTTLHLRKCVLKVPTLSNLCEELSSEEEQRCQIQDLLIDFDKDINDAKL